MSIFDGKPNLPGGFFSLADIANLGKSSTQNENSHRLADALGGLLGLSSLAPQITPPPRTRLAELARALSAPRPDTDEFIQAVWEKAPIAVGFDARFIRKDRYGAYIARDEYGQSSQYGWHIDHIIPQSKGGSDQLHNREPLHWRHNLAKSDKIF